MAESRARDAPPERSTREEHPEAAGPQRRSRRDDFRDGPCARPVDFRDGADRSAPSEDPSPRMADGVTDIPRGALPVRRSVVRSVALPIEHGGWAFLLEPMLVGLLATFSWTGLVLAIGTLAAFLVHQPLKTAARDRLAGRRAPRTILAERFAVAYVVVAGACIGWVVWTATAAVVPAAVLFAPFALLQLGYDLRGRSRALVPELAGAAALAALATATATIDGWSLAPALGLWTLLVARSAPSIVYVRARLLLEHGKPCGIGPTAVTHAAAIVAGLALWWFGLAPATAPVALAILLGRAVHGLSANRVGRRPAAIGAQESLFGLAYVLAIWLGLGAG